MARKMTEWPSKRGPITKIMPSDGCIGDTVPLAVGKWYDFHEFGWYMGNVGYYVMCGKEYRQEVLASATGTTVKHTSPERLRRFRFLIPPLPEQRAIAHILGTLDDKIELNRRMNETLEAMARALFKDWFVDFGPTRAKIEGRDPYLAQEMWVKGCRTSAVAGRLARTRSAGVGQPSGEETAGRLCSADRLARPMGI